ncbi:DUF1189 domain-containing protein [Bacillus sp. V3B]|uniref:DUF1189 domain-containing protein n=1 Tax=Bacillus sp. V3B TaxID=2804915 RepID=UPI00210D20A4|nr:DUF1189 domain-containing protein [Bacillus sp. V3B]MCQ6273681.1 DUF1189 domain-containing protein [Bacillus sp. V3B]
MNIFKQLIVSLYSPKDISTFRQQGIGKTILYVFFLTLLSVLPSFYYFSTSITAGFHALEETVQNELPSFTIENGELISDEQSPITINKNDFTIIFDSTGTVDQTNASRSDNTFFLLKNEVIYSDSGQTQSMPYSTFGNVNIAKEDLLSFFTSIDSILPIMIPVIDTVIYLFSASIKFIEISVLALFGLVLKNMMLKNMSYRHLWRMATYSVTLPTIFFTIMEGLKTTVPNAFFIHWFVAIMMLMLTLKEIPSEKIAP